MAVRVSLKCAEREGLVPTQSDIEFQIVILVKSSVHPSFAPRKLRSKSTKSYVSKIRNLLDIFN